jgi:DNA-binding NtrC family response regulator
MAKYACTVLIADDDKYIRDDLSDLLKGTIEVLLLASTAKETWQAISEHKPDLVLLDIRFPDCTDLSLLKRIKEETSADVIVLTSQTENIPQIVNAIKLGAFDYVPKPFTGAELLNRIEKALGQRALLKSREYLLNELEAQSGLGCLIGRSAAMEQARQTIRRLAQTDGCVLLRGESGTGKELAARALHYLSRRRSNPFIVVNCASIPEALVESVFFGHRRGAFTGAVENMKGKFEAAEDGTLFLDEIGDMPLAQQASLLRVLEYRHFVPVGETRERECRARFVLASNRDLRERVDSGAFREDLFYRINVAAITLPPLRSRPEDVADLAEHFRIKLGLELGRPPVRISQPALELLAKYDWPGNVRELKHVLEGAMMLLGPDQDEIALRDLPPELLAMQPRDGQPGEQLGASELHEKRELLRALQECGGNQSQAARLLGYHRNTIRSKIRYYGIR